VAGAAIRFDGQLSVYDTRDAASPCYACLFPPDAAFEETRCAVLGVFAPVVGTIGTLQASEALKLLAGIGPSLAGKLLMFDGRSTASTPCAWRAIRTAASARSAPRARSL
jgi:molybdopterin/thiamine biosynthesis adenylyltransferase